MEITIVSVGERVKESETSADRRTINQMPIPGNINPQSSRTAQPARCSLLFRRRDLQKQAGGDPALPFAVGGAFARLGHYKRAEAAFDAVLTARTTDWTPAITAIPPSPTSMFNSNPLTILLAATVPAFSLHRHASRRGSQRDGSLHREAPG
jgi:hypothetical protein